MIIIIIKSVIAEKYIKSVKENEECSNKNNLPPLKRR